MKRTKEMWRQEFARLNQDRGIGDQFNHVSILADPSVLYRAADDLTELIPPTLLEVGSTVNCIVAFEEEDSYLAMMLAQFYGLIHNGAVGRKTPCRFAFTRRDSFANSRTVFGPCGSLVPNIRKGDRVIVCKNTLTRDLFLDPVVAKIQELGGIVVPIILTLVNYSGLQEINLHHKNERFPNARIISLIDVHQAAEVKGRVEELLLRLV